MTIKKGETIFFSILAAIGAAIFVGAMQTKSFIEEPVSASKYGMVVSGLLILVSLIRIIQNIAAMKKDAGKKVTVSYLKLVLIMGVLMIVYSFGITKIGYFTSTFVLTWISLVILSGQKQKKDIIKYAVFAVVFCLFLYLMFQLMGVYLPNTPLI